jgi:hypothetical protein
MQYPPNGNPQQPYGQQQPYSPQSGFVSQPLQPGYVQPAPQPSMPQFTPPTQQPKKPKRWPWIVALVVVFFIGIAIGSATHSGSSTPATTTVTQSGGGTQSQPAPTTKPAAPAKWTTTQTFTGSGAKKTATFAVGNDWKILYTCSGMNVSGYTSDANLIVGVYNSDGSIVDPAAINTICKAGKTTSDNTEEHQGGNVYLDVNAEGDWTITVQELK